MSAAPMNWLITLVVVIIVGIIAILVVKWLLAAAMITPFAYAEEEQKTVDKVEKTINDTDITVTCTSNIPNLVSCD